MKTAREAQSADERRRLVLAALAVHGSQEAAVLTQRTGLTAAQVNGQVGALSKAGRIKGRPSRNAGRKARRDYIGSPKWQITKAGRAELRRLSR